MKRTKVKYFAKNKKSRSVFSKANSAVALIVVVTILGGYSYDRSREAQINNQTAEPTIQQQTTEEQTDVAVEPIEQSSPVVETPAPKPAPAKKWPVQLSSAQASSLTVVVNKKHKLPSNFVPTLKSASGGQLRPEAADALQALLNDATAAGVGMKVISSYRSYQTQVTTYQKWVNLQGQAEADRGSARPGHSEHQTGLAVDLDDGSGCPLLECFGDTAAGKWLEANSHNYGFIIRYPAGKEALTGYQYEPWHLRFVGVGEAQAIVSSGKTMDQYYGVEAGGY